MKINNSMLKLKTWSESWAALLTLIILISTTIVSISMYIIQPKEQIANHENRITVLEKDNKEYYKDVAVIKESLKNIETQLKFNIKTIITVPTDGLFASTNTSLKLHD